LLSLRFAVAAESSYDVEVIAQSAAVRRKASSRGPIFTTVKKGTHLKIVGEAVNNFYPVQTKSGKEAWIKVSDVRRIDADSENDLITGEGGRKSRDEESGEKGYPRFGLTAGGAAGTSNSSTFYEINVGLDTQFNSWLTWRNAPFYRLRSGSSSVFGLDTTARAQYILPIDASIAPRVHAGIGYRFVSTGSHAPLVELGGGGNLAGINVDISVKHILNSLITKGATNDTILAFGVSGRASF
jgi:hypothetical protein